MNISPKSALQILYNTFDNTGYSIWFLHYDKTKSQGESMLKASNFKSMFLQVSLVF